MGSTHSSCRGMPCQESLCARCRKNSLCTADSVDAESSVHSMRNKVSHVREVAKSDRCREPGGHLSDMPAIRLAEGTPHGRQAALSGVYKGGAGCCSDRCKIQDSL